MNCKPGDLAIVVRSTKGNEGRVVKCLRFEPAIDYAIFGLVENCWLVEGNLMGQNTQFHIERGCNGSFPDAWLKPLRPDGITTEEVKELFSPSSTKESEKV